MTASYVEAVATVKYSHRRDSTHISDFAHMPRPHRKLTLHRSAVRFTAAALLVFSVGACHTWVPTQLGPSQQFVNGRTRVHHQDGRATIMMGPRVEGDSVIGRVDGSSARVALARQDVERIEVQRVSRGRTAIVGIGLLALYYVAAFSFSNSPH
jgi:hypothetical protein